ncbi:MAG TPA: ABC transporter substrate-binding protein [Candidatus Limnocylindrales bacterium]
MSFRRPVRLVSLMLAASLAAACSGSQASPTPATTPLVVGLGFIPSVQFAPFYLAQQKGYYTQAGLQVTFQSKIDPDLITLVGQGSVDVGLADGTSVIPAVSQGIPIRYVATVYRAFPSIVFAKSSSGIASAADLKGRKLGIPGRYGSSWIMLQALLQSAGLSPSDLTITEFPDFGQGAAVQQGAVDAATGFVNNEPVQLAQSGQKTTVLHVDQIVPLPGPGLIAGTKALASDPKRAAIGKFVEATLHAMRDIAADPDAGLTASIAAVPELGQSRDAQKAILAATIAAWKGSGTAADFGAIDAAAWTKSIDFMSKLKDETTKQPLVSRPVTAGDVIDDQFVRR